MLKHKEKIDIQKKDLAFLSPFKQVLFKIKFFLATNEAVEKPKNLQKVMVSLKIPMSLTNIYIAKLGATGSLYSTFFQGSITCAALLIFRRF